jgi:hypothetical protein
LSFQVLNETRRRLIVTARLSEMEGIEMSVKSMTIAVLVGVAVCGQGAIASAEDGYPIAGTQPSQRPVGAPVISDLRKEPGWYSRALTGISQPYPPSLRFLEDQGNWYTPFNRPGMYGRYDIRGWYRQ